MPFLLQGVRFRIRCPKNGDRLGVQFDSLAASGRLDDLPGDDDAGPGGHVVNLLGDAGQIRRYDSLNVRETGTVVDFDERESALAVATCADPPPHLSGFAGGRILQQVADPSVHDLALKDPRNEGPSSLCRSHNLVPQHIDTCAGRE